jgi:ABC-2 type transport system permease protein
MNNSMDNSTNGPANSQSGAMPESSQAIAPAALASTRPMYWSVRRELWENRSIYIAPLIAAALGILAFLIGLFGLGHGMRELVTTDPVRQRVMLAMPYSHAAWLMMATAFIVGVFYSLDALHGERRDRSILFWKSLPVSDLTTVLSKASIPLVVLPLIVFAIMVIVHPILLLLSTLAPVLSGAGAATLRTQLSLFQMELVLLYALAVLALWHAPIYAWLLLVSGWARRATFLWALLPPLAIAIFERLAFRTSYVDSLLSDRFFGFATKAFDFTDKNGVLIDPHFIPLTQLAPGRFLSSPSLWVGLIVAAALLALTVRLRRYREPI